MKEMGSEFDPQEDMIELAQELTQSNFNVKQFKRMHAAKHIKLSNNRTLSRIYTEHSESKLEAGGMSLHSKTVGQGLNKTLRYNDTFIPPKKQPKFFSKPLVKSAEKFQESRSKKKILPSEKEVSKLQRYQREWSRGKIKQRCIEEWLNAILIEYCHDEYFDKAIANSALKKLGIDQNSLVAKGLPPQNITRLYRGLFVFGMGFNSLIQELTNGNIEVLKAIWRIYSIILEYCSKGGMVTVIGEIQRDTSAKIAVLTSEIVRKQHIIQRNEELNQQKNAEIFRQIKKLREDNVNLNNEKTVLVEEYNSTQQAFSEEVGLRLKFQTKINQIYGLHRELGIKHQRLFQELSQKVEELRTCADKYFQSTIKTQQFKQTQYKLRQQLILLRLSSKKQTQYVEQLVRERIELLSKISKLQYISLQLQNEVSELRNREKRWINDKINMEATIQFRQKSSKETHQEYQITLEENNRLYILLSDQRKIMEEYEKEKKNFNSKVISIVSENSYHKRKMEQAQRKLDSLQEAHKELVQKMQQLNLQLEIKTKSEQSFQSFFSNSEQSLVEMRKINIANQEELAFLRKYHANMERVLKEKNQNLEVLANKHNKTMNQAERLTVQLQELRSKYVILTQQKRIADQTYVLKQAKLKVIQQELDIKRQQLEKIKLSYGIEEQRLRTSLEQVLINYKNQKFQRATLNSSYMQTLKIVEKKNVTERELNVKISLLEGDIEKEKTRYQLLEKNMRQTVNKMTKTQELMESTMELQREIIVKKQQYRNPMYVQDLTAALQREIQRNTEKTARIKFLEIQLQKSKKFGEQELQRQGQKYRWDMTVLSKQAQNKIELLNNQLAFQKKNSAQLKEQLRQYEILADSYRKKISQRQTSERQEIYKKAIQEKKKEAQAMLVQMEKLQDKLQESQRRNAELSLRESTPLQSGEQSHRGKAQAIRKELEHQYDLKFRELQRQMKQQISRKEQQLKEEQQSIIRGMSVQQFLKAKDMKPSELIKQLSMTQKTDKFREFSSHHSVEMNRETFYKKEMARNNEDLKNRRQINRLIKHAYDYYN